MLYPSGNGSLVEVKACRERYFNGALCVQLYCEDGPFGTITVNIPGSECPAIGDDFAYVDTNNYPSAEEFIRKNKLGKPVAADVNGTTMRLYAESGYCIYPLYKFDLSKLSCN